MCARSIVMPDLRLSANFTDGLQVCVIDEADDVDRSNAWMGAGTSALIDGNEPLDQLFRTINRLLRRGSVQQTERTSSPSWR